MDLNNIANKTQEKLMAANPESLTNLEQIIQELIMDKGMNLKQAIEALGEPP